MEAAIGSWHRIADAAWFSLAGEIDSRSSDFYGAELQATGSTTVRHSLRASNWVRRLHEFELFWARSGRHPRENTRDRSVIPAVERRSGEWARYQRRFEVELCAYQRARLDLSPAFEWDPLDSAWERNLHNCETYFVKLGRLPILTTADRDEFRAARWLGRQLEARRIGGMTADRAGSIDRLMSLATLGRQQHGTGTFRHR